MTPVWDSDYFLGRSDIALFSKAVQSGTLFDFLFQQCWDCTKDEYGNIWLERSPHHDIILIQPIDYSPNICDIAVDASDDSCYLRTKAMYNALLITYWLTVLNMPANFLFWNQSIDLKKIIPSQTYSLVVSLALVGQGLIAIQSENAYSYQIQEQCKQINDMLYGYENVCVLLDDAPFLEVDAPCQILLPAGSGDGQGELHSLDFSLRLAECLSQINWAILEPILVD